MRKLIFIITLFFIASCASSSGIKTNNNENGYAVKVEKKYSVEIEKRIESIINNLQLSTALSGIYKTSTLKKRMDETHTPGVSIAVINNGKVEWVRGFGVKNYESKEPVKSDTLFLAGSISKPVFASAVMKMVQDGKIALDKDVNNYLKSWKVPVSDDWQPVVTFRQILSHTAGFTVHGFPGYLKTDKIPTVSQILNGEKPSNTQSVKVVMMPGMQFRYSGGGITVAQLAVEDMFEGSFSEIMEKELFTPLNLTNSTYSQKPLPKYENRKSAGHPKKNIKIEGNYHIYPEMSAAGLWTTPEDLAKLILEIQKGVKGKSKFFNKKTVNEMLTPQKTAPFIGIGFFLEKKKTGAIFTHGGWDEGFVAKVLAYKDRGQGVIVMVNSNEGNSIMDEIIRAVAIEYKWKGVLVEKSKPIQIEAEIIKKYEGVYKTNNGMIFTLSTKDNKLFLQYENQNPLELLAKTPTDFFAKNIKIEIKVIISKEKGTNSIMINQVGKRFSAKKQENGKK